MRSFGTRKASAVIVMFAVAATLILAAGASTASFGIDMAQSNLTSFFPDATTGGLMLVSFVLIGAGVRARKRSVVLS